MSWKPSWRRGRKRRRFDPGDGNPWEYPNPLNLSFAHFKNCPKCPICGFGPGAHLYYVEREGMGQYAKRGSERVQKWGCPTEHETPGEVLARLGAEVSDE